MVAHRRMYQYSEYLLEYCDASCAEQLLCYDCLEEMLGVHTIISDIEDREA